MSYGVGGMGEIAQDNIAKKHGVDLGGLDGLSRQQRATVVRKRIAEKRIAEAQQKAAEQRAERDERNKQLAKGILGQKGLSEDEKSTLLVKEGISLDEIGQLKKSGAISPDIAEGLISKARAEMPEEDLAGLKAKEAAASLGQPQAAPQRAPAAGAPAGPAMPPRSGVGGFGKLFREEQETTKAGMDALATAQQRRNKAAEQSAEAIRAEAEAAAKEAARVAAAQSEFRKAQERDAQELQAKREAHRDALRKARDDYKAAASQKVDAGRFRRENASKFAFAGIAMFAMQRAATLTGGPDNSMAFMQMFEEQVNQDIDAQKANIANAKDAASNEYKALMDEWGDEITVTNIMRARRADSLKSALDQITAESAGPKAQVAAQKAIAALNMDQANSFENSIKSQSQMAGQSISRQADLISRRNQAAMQREELDLKRAMAMQEQAGKVEKYAIHGYRKTGESYINDATFKEAQAGAAGFGTIKAALARAKDLRSKYGAEKLDRTAVAEMSRIGDTIAESLSMMGNTGVLNKDEWVRFKEQVGDMTGAGFQMARLEAMEKDILMKERIKMRAYGYANEEDATVNTLGGVEVK